MPSGKYIRTAKHRQRARETLFATRQRADVQEKLRLAQTGERNNFYGKTHTAESRKIIGEKSKVMWANNPTLRTKFSNRIRRKWQDPEFRQAVINSRIGSVMSAEARAKISAAGLGRSRGRVLEINIEAKVVNWARDRGLVVFKTDPRHCAGAPDRFFLLPSGKCVFIEFKKPGHKPRKIQFYVHRQLRMLGHTVYVVDDVEKGIAILQKVLQK